jgi:hypothetical protein
MKALGSVEFLIFSPIIIPPILNLYVLLVGEGIILSDIDGFSG